MEQFGNILELIAISITAVGLILVWYRLKLLNRQAVFQYLNHFQAIILKPELQEALRFIYSCDPSQLSNPKGKEELEKIELILNNYDLLAWRIQKGVIPLKDVLEIEWPVLLRFWQQLNGFVKAEQKRRNNMPYKESLKWLINKAKEYRKTHYPDVEIKIHRRNFMQMRKGASVLFVDNRDHIILVLLVLRDDIDGIPYPNCWDILGGHVEENECPKQCIIREMKEELGLEIEPNELHFFQKYYLNDRREYTFWKKADSCIDETPVYEGQYLRWFSKEDVEKIPESEIAFGFKPIILEFFEKAPF